MSHKVFVKFLSPIQKVERVDYMGYICYIYSSLLHLSLLGVQDLLLFSFLWSVCLRWQGDHTVHTHFKQVKALILT